MKRTIFILALILPFQYAFPQGSVATIQAGSELVVGAGARFCADTINVYGTLNCASVACVCSHNKVFCYGTCIPPELSGANPTISGPVSVDFGSVQVGLTLNTEIDISNTGNAPLHISATSISPAQFSIVANGGARTLQIGEAVTLTLSFSPVMIGPLAGTLTIESDAENAPTLIIPLAGSGVAQGPTADFNPASVHFGSVGVGQHATQNVTVSNTGDSPLHIAGEAISGIDASDFAIEQQVAGTILAGGSTTLAIRFAPQSLGAKSAVYTCSTNDPAHSTVTIALSGDATNDMPIIAVDPTSVDFGTTAPNVSVQANITIRNNGAANLVMQTQDVMGTGFSLTANATWILTPSASSTAKLLFTPTSEGQYQGTFTITSNDPVTPSVVVDLVGTCGTSTPCLAASSNSVTFPETATGAASTESVDILNSCSSIVHIAAYISGTGFSITTPQSVDIAGNASATIGLEFRPPALGQYTGTVSVISFTPSQSLDIALSGSSTSTGLSPLPEVPSGIVLRQNYPNPFNPVTSIVYETDRVAEVKLEVYSLFGKRVATLADTRLEPGVYRTAFDASGMPSGTYAAVLRVITGSMTQTRTILMTLLQ